MIELIAWTLLTLGIVTSTIAAARYFGLEIATALYAALTVTANVVAFKIVSVGKIGGLALVAPAGVIVYSSTFLITDFLSEIAGKERAKRAVLAGILANLAAVAAIQIAVVWTPAGFMSGEDVEAFERVFSYTPRIVAASIVAFVISQFHDIYAYHFWKVVARGRFLWLRNNASTMTSQAIDTVVFITLAFYGVLPADALIAVILSQYVVKVIIAALDTPFLYAATIVWKKLEVKPEAA